MAGEFVSYDIYYGFVTGQICVLALLSSAICIAAELAFAFAHYTFVYQLFKEIFAAL